jgi:hypothetical protein
MSNARPLCLYPHDIPDDQMQLIRQAKANLDLPYKVIPSPAVPGGHERVLAMGELPPFLCDAALVKDPTNAQSVENALRWLLTAPEGDNRGFGYGDYLEAIFGAPVTELEPETVEQTVKFG